VAQVVDGPDGRKLAVEISGDPDGAAVFLMHGTPGALLGPRPRYIFLYRLGIRLISYNRPGYPGSDRMPNRAVSDAAADVEAIANHFDIEKFSVIGRSGGGPHALACAAHKSLRDRVICTAALSSLAPIDASLDDWYADMTESNVQAYQDAGKASYDTESSNLQALIATFHQRAQEVRNGSQGLLDNLRPELAESDRKIIGDIAIRRMLAQTHTEALSRSVDGWVDDAIALAHPWGTSFADIIGPVLLWHGGEDKFSPVSHTRWLHEEIKTSVLTLRSDAAHFESIKILPEILRWILDNVNEAPACASDSLAAPGASVGSSERLWDDPAEQASVGADGGNVGMLSTDLVH
jgi:pimeloyl-ACP methyl ester carboxylesterase